MPQVAMSIFVLGMNIYGWKQWANSTPRPGTMNPYTGKLVTEANKKQHEKWRCNYDAMKELLNSHEDYQLKPVISNKNELEEFRALQKILSVPNNKVI